MQIIFDAQLVPGGHHGGIEQLVQGLVRALGRLDGDETYIVASHWRNPDWLKPYIGSNQKIVTSLSYSQSGATRLLPQSISVPMRRLWRKAREYVAIRAGGAPTVPASNGFYESLNANVLHFPFQGYVRSNLPCIYCPHDLQHLHFPQFFPSEQIAWRETIYRAGCAESQAITVGSQFAKDDIVKQYGIAPEKIYVTHWAPPTDVYSEVNEESLTHTRNKFNLPQIFAFYPAQTWRHKNHLRLLEALAILRDRDHITLNLVCAGTRSEFWRVIEKHIREMRLEYQASFLGFVKPHELRTLYHLAQFVIHPSLFEGGGLPILEAFREGVPVACSNTTSLPEYAGDAALYFDPVSPESIANAAKRMATDEALRASLCARGAARVRTFTWERTAKMYRTLYRHVAGGVLSNEDHELLAYATAISARLQSTV